MNAATVTDLIRQRLLAPVNLAAHVTWIAVAIEVASRRLAAPAGIACLLLFLAGFVWRALPRANVGQAGPRRRVNADLLTPRSLLADGVREAERLRLTRELHDVSGHKLTALKLHLTAPARDPGQAAGGNITRAAVLAGGLLADIRAVVSKSCRHDGIAIGEMLKTLSRAWPAPRVPLTVGESLRVDDIERAEALLRFAQEGLTNAARHALDERVWIELDEQAGALTMRIEDDGRGADPLVPGLGLTGMRERVAALNGTLEIDHGPRGGMRLTLRLPGAAAVA